MFCTFYITLAWLFIRYILIGFFVSIFAWHLFFYLYAFSTEIYYELSVIIIKVLQILFADGLIRELLCGFKIWQSFRFIVLEDFNRVILRIFIDIVRFNFKTEFFLHTWKVFQELLRIFMGCNLRWTDNAFSSVLLQLFDFIKNIILGFPNVKRFLFYLWHGIIIIFQKRTYTEI